MPKAKTAPLFPEWDYLVVSASNDRQAEAYRRMLDLRVSLGLVSGAGKILVVPDPGGRRVGSGGSTIHCLERILEAELGRRGRSGDSRSAEEALSRLRILIVHAGGDSKRLPPYGPCGKIFIPIPGEAGGAAGTTIFDRLVPTYFALPQPQGGGGQVVVASGDVLLDLDAAEVVFEPDGITGVGALAAPEVARNHGVYCPHRDGGVRLFLQKPSVARQAEMGAVDAHGHSVLDIGILNLAPRAAVKLMELREVAGMGELDIYREISCAIGKDARPAGYLKEVRAAGSKFDDGALRKIYADLRHVPFHLHVVPRFRFLHFGTLHDLLESGRSLVEAAGVSEPDGGEHGNIVVNCRKDGSGSINGKGAWIEGCRIDAPLTLGGNNVFVGVDVEAGEAPLALERGTCVDVIEGAGRSGRRGWFVRTYASDDAFHVGIDRDVESGASLCGLPGREWPAVMGVAPDDIWDAARPEAERTIWDGRFFPIVRRREEWRTWLWMAKPRAASEDQKRAWRAADRYSLEEIAVGADLTAFLGRRLGIRSGGIRRSLGKALGTGCDLSAAEFAYLAGSSGDGDAGDDERCGVVAGLGEWVAAFVREALRRRDGGLEALEISRILHTLGSVLEKAGKDRGRGPRAMTKEAAAALRTRLSAGERATLENMGAGVERMARGEIGFAAWARQLKDAAFRNLGRTIVEHGGTPMGESRAAARAEAGVEAPRNALRSDEIVWGRAPARLDLGGGWTDTPPYSLERGGCVINAAAELNGQAPIQAYARVIERREIRINSIDHSTRLVIRDLDELLDYGEPASQFGLAKAALALAGFAPEASAWPTGTGRSLERMLRHFGGGIELTTLAAIPSGSGLGTSSIMGAVLMSIIARVVGRPLGQRELFHAVLKLEQELTTGGGWQDQIGGAVEGVKMITAERGLVPDPRIHFVPADLLDPAANGGRTLLYYTGLRRLAKNILHEVVGRYLDRDRRAMETLRRLHAFPPVMAEAMAMRDMERFGRLIDVAWRLNVDLDPDHTTPEIEAMRTRIAKHVIGAKLLGAGGGGFLLMVCATAADAAAVRRTLEREPPNPRARFFDYSISKTGLVVTVC